MPANGAVYIPQAKFDLADIFAGAKSDKGLFRNASYYGVKLGTDVVRCNIMPPAAGIQMASSGLMPVLSSLIPKFHFSIEAAFGTTTHELQIVTPSEIRAVPASKRASACRLAGVHGCRPTASAELSPEGNNPGTAA